MQWHVKHGMDRHVDLSLTVWEFLRNCLHIMMYWLHSITTHTEVWHSRQKVTRCVEWSLILPKWLWKYVPCQSQKHNHIKSQLSTHQSVISSAARKLRNQYYCEYRDSGLVLSLLAIAVILHHGRDFRWIMYKISTVELLWCQLGSPVNGGIQC